MGIDGLWEHIKPAVHKESLTTLALRNGVGTPATYKPFRIGVDISIWFALSQQRFMLAHAQAGENPELKLMFNRIARLFRSPVLPIFVFDGPARPAMKRNKTIMTKDHWLAAPTRALIDAFGFTYIDAPGEAEAELASMNKNGIIDAVLTDDGDTLVFGATTIIRNPVIKRDGDDVDVYMDNARQCMDELRALTREGFILVAVLVGGDYDPQGLRACGISTAVRLARYGLGEQLVAAAMLPAYRSAPAMAAWRARLRAVLRSDPDGHLGRRCPAAANNVADNFPDLDIVHAYCTPLVTDPAVLRATLDTTWKMPDLVKLCKVCEVHFDWAVEREIVPKFLNLIWPGVLLRYLCHAQASAGTQVNAPIDPVERFEITTRSTRSGLPVYKVNMSTSAFTDVIRAGLSGSRAITRVFKCKCRKLNADALEVHGYPVDIPVTLMAVFQPESVKLFKPGGQAYPPETSTKSNVRIKNGRQVRTIVAPQPAVRIPLWSVVRPSASSSILVTTTASGSRDRRAVLSAPNTLAGCSTRRADAGTVDVIDLTLSDSDEDVLG